MYKNVTQCTILCSQYGGEYTVLQQYNKYTVWYTILCTVQRVPCAVYCTHSIQYKCIGCTVQFSILYLQCSVIHRYKQQHCQHSIVHTSGSSISSIGSVRSIVYTAYIETGTIMTGVAPLRRHSIRRTKLEGDQQNNRWQ